MNMPLYLLTGWLLLTFTTGYAQQSSNEYQYEYDHDTANYEYNHEYHYEHGMYGYRHEAEVLDSLLVLEMMDSLTHEEMEYQWEDFQERKKEAKRKKEKKEKEKRERKKEKKRKPRDKKQSLLRDDLPVVAMVSSSLDAMPTDTSFCLKA